MQEPRAGGEQECPSCGISLPVSPGYLTWCDVCGWNLTAPPERRPARGRIGRAYAAAGARAGRRMARRLQSRESLEPRLTAGQALAYAVAAGVHLLTLALVGGAVVLMVLFPRNVTVYVLAVPMLLTAWLMRPRLGKPPEHGIVEPERTPRLHSLAAEVAAALGTPPPDRVVVRHDFNASWGVYGLRRTRVLTLGLPLVAALEPQERVALVAHELAHGRNGDIRRGVFIGSAVRALGEMYGVLAPGDEGSTASSRLAVLGPVVNGILWLLSRPPLLLLKLEFHLLMRNSQRAEYLADALAAEVAGSAAVVGLQEKTLLEGTFDMVVRRSVHGRRDPSGLVGEAAAALLAVPERERERRRRVARLEETQLDATHPPTALRIELVESLARQPKVVLDARGSSAIDAELQPSVRAVEQRLLEDARAALYY
jgi:heat shock protein HtpX